MRDALWSLQLAIFEGFGGFRGGWGCRLACSSLGLGGGGRGGGGNKHVVFVDGGLQGGELDGPFQF